jgi:hypothetical protein
MYSSHFVSIALSFSRLRRNITASEWMGVSAANAERGAYGSGKLGLRGH